MAYDVFFLKAARLLKSATERLHKGQISRGEQVQGFVRHV